MNILIYCAHPAQYHFFKNIMERLAEKGHVIKLLIKTKDILETLVKEDGWEYKNLLPEKRGHSFFSLVISLFKRDFRMYKIASDFQPDLLMGCDASVTHIGWMLGKPRIIVGEDDYRIVKLHNWLMMPFATAVIAPYVCNLGPFEKKKKGFNGYLKAAYLHPDVFTPDYRFVTEANLSEPFCIIRMVRLTAHHDKKINGLTSDIVSELISKLSSEGIHVYLDCEGEFPTELSCYRLRIKKNVLHHVMAFATLVISDSQSMSVEASLLGVPSLRFNDFAGKISVLDELEHKYNLTKGIPASDPRKLFTALEGLLSDDNLKAIFRERKDRMLKEKINTLDFMVSYIDQLHNSYLKVK